MQSRDMSDEEISRKGMEIYETRLRILLEPHRNGAKVAICVDDGDYAVAPSTVEAIQTLGQRHPDAVFFLGEVGKPLSEWPWIHADVPAGKH